MTEPCPTSLANKLKAAEALARGVVLALADIRATIELEAALQRSRDKREAAREASGDAA